MKFSSEKLEAIRSDLGSKSAQEILSWALRTFGDRVVLATSFGLEGVALIDMASKLGMPYKVLTLDTGRLPEETYEVMDRIREKYKISVEVYFPDAAKVEALVRSKGLYSFRQSVENRKECCGIRKVEPLQRALKHRDAWVTGLRREQSVTRTDLSMFEIDDAHGGMLKINPLIDWSGKKVWEYVRKNKVPYNKLHDQGYPSVGCQPCTRAVKPGEDIRSGRWWWERPEHKECGIHR